MGRQLPPMLYRALRLVPEVVRQRVVRALKPSYTIGASCLIEHAGNVLLVRPRYRRGWGLPGGLLNRGESPADGAAREVLEEVGLEVSIVGEPCLVVDSRLQKVDVLYRATLPDGTPDELVLSNEIAEARWFDLDDSPALQPEALEAFAALRNGPSVRIVGAT